MWILFWGIQPTYCNILEQVSDKQQLKTASHGKSCKRRFWNINWSQNHKFPIASFAHLKALKFWTSLVTHVTSLGYSGYLMADFLAAYKDALIFFPNMHLWQCDVPEDRSRRHWGMNDIKRPGIQPQPIHMQIASLALTLINSLWVHSFPVNKDLAAFEWSSTLSVERQRERELVANLTVKPPQDIMQPPFCWPNPPRRCRTEPVLVQETRKRRQKKAALLFLIPSQQQKSSKAPWLNSMNDLRLSQSRAVCPVEPMNENGSCCFIALPVFAYQQRPYSIAVSLIACWLKSSLIKWRFV